MEEHKIREDIGKLKTFWAQRNNKFREWYEILVLVDTLSAKGLESYVSNEPQTFYDMAHFLLTRGELAHLIPIEGESSIEYDRRARVNRACQYVWKLIDRQRQLGGQMSFHDELSFFILVLGWYSSIGAFDEETGLLQAQVWNPYDTYPRYADGRMVTCLHSYKITEEEAAIKADSNGWSFQSTNYSGMVDLDDYWRLVGDTYYNIYLIGGKPVTNWTPRPEAKLLVAPIGGFPDRGSLTPGRTDWKRLVGRGIFESNEKVGEVFNKWKTMVSQILRDTANPITEEFSATPQATPEQLRERGAHFHYAPGEQGLVRLPPAAIPIELQAHLLEIRRELMKGSFSDAVFGMVEGGTGYALSMMAEASANQILYPYVDGKHFVFEELDRFWLSKLKTTKRVFEVRGQFVEKLKPTDIPEDVTVTVTSELATPKDWLQRGQIANQLKEFLDENTIITEILRMQDPQAIQRRKTIDMMRKHPVFQLVELISAARNYAEYLIRIGDRRTAETFMRVAMALELQLGAPAPGQAAPPEAVKAEAARMAGAPAERARIRPETLPPEERGFTPAQLREVIGRGTIRR